MSRREAGASRHATPNAAANRSAANTMTPQQNQVPVSLGEYMRMAPSTAYSQGAPMRAASAGRLHRAMPSSAPAAGEKTLGPLPPPRIDAVEAEQGGLASAEQRHLLAQRLHLLASHQEEQLAAQSPAQPQWRHSLPTASSPRSLGKSKVKADTESIRELGPSHLWATLDPFDPKRDPALMAALKKGSGNRGDQHRSPSSSRERYLDNFKPSFRTDWLIALRRELLDGVKEESAQLRRDLNDAVNDMRADFADAMDGKLDASGTPKKPRLVEVNFTPVLQEIRKRKEELDQTMKNMREEFDLSPFLRSVMQALEDLKKEQVHSRSEVVKVCKTSAGNVAKELAKNSQMVKDNRVDLKPVLEAIRKLDMTTAVDLDPVLHAIKEIDVQPQVDLDSVLAAVKDIDASVLQAVVPPLTELTERSKQQSTELESKFVGLDTRLVSLDAKQDQQREQMNGVFVQLDSKVSECVETGTATVLTETATYLSPILQELSTLKQIATASEEAIGKIDLTRLEEQVAGSQQAVTSELSAQLSKTAEEISNPKVDFTPVLDAVRKINLDEVLQDNRNRQEAILKEVKASSVDLQPVLHAISNINFASDFGRVTEALERVDSKQCVANRDLEAALCLLKQVDAKPPPDLEGALRPVLEAVAAIDVQPVVPLDEVMDALKAIDSKQSASFASIAGTVQESAATLEGSIAKIQLQEEDVAHGLAAARGQLEVLHAVSEASNEAIAKMDLDAVMELVREVGKRHETGQQWLVHLLAGLEVQPRVDLQPILEAISKIDVGAVTQCIDASRADMAEGLHVAAAARHEALTSVLEAAAKGEAATTKVLEAISRAEARSHICHEDLLESHTRTDTKLKDEFAMLQDVVGKINVNPVVDMRPIVNEIAKIDVHPIVKTDTRPMLDIVSAGLARVEVAWAKVDLREVLESIKKVDNRLLEAMVKIDAKAGRHENLIWTPPDSTW